MEGVAIVPIPLDGSRPFIESTFTDSTGVFSFDGLAAGEYGTRVLISSPDGYGGSRPGKIDLSRFSLAPGQRLNRDVVLLAPSGANLRATIVRPDVDDLYRVSIRLDSEHPSRRFDSVTMIEPDITSFVVNGIASGGYTLSGSMTTRDGSGQFGHIPVELSPSRIDVPLAGDLELTIEFRTVKK